MDWMAWTGPTALFFATIALALGLMTILEIRYPTKLRKGFLPIETTRGDRFFIALLSSAFVHLSWLGIFGSMLVAASLLSLIWSWVLLRWG